MKGSQLAALGLVAALSFGLQGCIVVADGDGIHTYDKADYEEREERNRKAIASFNEGATLKQVENEMGTPNFSDLVTVDGVRYRVMYYRTNRVHADGNTTKDECTPLVFADGVLIGTGDLALARIPHHD